MISRKHNLEYDELVVGGTIHALRFAKDKNLPLVCVDPQPPHRFQKEYVAGEYSRVWFLHSLSGKIPFDSKIEAFRIVEEGVAKATTSSGFLFNIKYNKIFLFDDDGVEGLPSPKTPTQEIYEVIDWIDVRSGMSHEHDRIESTSDFVKCVLFYPTERLDGHHPDKKDAAAISYLTREQLEDPEYSELYARFKTEEMMRAAGIKGQSCGNNNYALKVESSHRDVRPLHKNLYDSVPTIEFIND